MREIKQGTAANVMVFMADEIDHSTGVTGLTLSVEISKDGGTFGGISPTVTERTYGWYNVALVAGDTDILGDLVVMAAAATADPAERTSNVVANIESDSVTLLASTALEVTSQSLVSSLVAAQLDIDRLLGLTLENHVEDDVVRDLNGNKLTSILYCYDSKANADIHNKTTGITATYAVTATYDAAGMVTFKVTLEP